MYKHRNNFVMFLLLAVKPMVLNQGWFLALRGHLAMSEDIFDYIWGKFYYRIQWIEVRDAAKYPT